MRATVNAPEPPVESVNLDPKEQAELLDLANDSIILCDAHRRITYWNRGSFRTYGWKREEVLGKELHDLLQTRFSDSDANVEESLYRDTNWEGELQQVRRDGTIIYVVSRWTVRDQGGNSAVLHI